MYQIEKKALGSGIKIENLIEKAAKNLWKSIEKKGIINKNTTFLLLIGKGNNGQDAIALGKILKKNKYQVFYYFIWPNSEQEKYPNTLNDQQLSQLINKFDIIIDGILGIGSRPIDDKKLLNILKKINQTKSFRLAIDIPTGINADTGQTSPENFQAHLTVTFGFPKVGLLLYPARSFAGKIEYQPIGLSKTSFRKKISIKYQLYQKKNLKQDYAQKKIKLDIHKGQKGKVLIIGGSNLYPNAVYLTALAAYRSGAGVVSITSDTNNQSTTTDERSIVFLPIQNYSKEEITKWYYNYSEIIDKQQVLIIGNGWTSQKNRINLLRIIIEKNTDQHLVLDADALGIISKYPSLLKNLSKRNKKAILTPHPQEMASLTNKEVDQIQNNRLQEAQYFANKHNVIIVLKGANPIIAYPNDSKTTIIDQQAPNMAVAGTGDVLAGIIGSLLAQGRSEKEAALMGTALCSIAGGEWFKKNGPHGMLASDLIKLLPSVINHYYKKSNQ